MTDMHTHASHIKTIARLQRANGHLPSVNEIIESGQSCLDIAQQLHAVEKAIVNAKRVLIHDPIDHYLEANGQASEMVEFWAIAR